MSWLRPIRHREYVAVLGGATLVAAVLAGCSSTSSSTSAAAPSTSSGGNLTGSPITVAINTPIASTYGDFPGSVAAVKAAARAINASGGIHGHPVNVITCETQGDPNLEVGCARKAVSGGAVATINSFIISNPNGYLQELASNHVADIGSEIVTPQFAEASNVFPLTFGYGAFAACTGSAMAKLAGGNRVTTYIAEIPSSEGLENLMIQGAKAQGSVWTGAAGTPSSVTDWSPIVQEVANLKPDIVIPGGGAQQYAPFLESAVQTGHKWTYCTFASGDLADKLSPLGSSGGSFYDGNALPTLAEENQIPALKTFAAQMQAEYASGDTAASVSPLKFNWETLQAWLGMQVFKQVANSISGTVTPAAFMSALEHTTFSGLGIIPSINFAHPSTYGSYTRVFDPYTYLERWNPSLDEFVMVANSKINGAEVLFGPAK